MTGRPRRREVLLVAHTGRPSAVDSARDVAKRLLAADIGVRVLAEEQPELALPGVTEVEPGGAAAAGTELVVVLGGDGTLLRAAALARPAGVALLGVNWGRVGFLAETEPEALEDTVGHVVERSYTVEERLTVEVDLRASGGRREVGWALNEVSVEKSARERMLDVVVEVDGRPLSRWGCDGVVCATPTGSTAYAFSAGGPVVWPAVEALLLVPISAHALFARPLVAAPTSVLAVEVQPDTPGAVVFCDGHRVAEVPAGTRVEVRRGRRPVLLARTHLTPFTDRLVAKFGLPVDGWRGRAR